MMDPRLWDVGDLSRPHFRSQNIVGRATLTRVDDTNPVQLFQSEGYPTELRGGMQNVGEHGHGSVQLPGAKAVIIYQGGDRSRGVAVGIVDPRYRLTGHQPGESFHFMVDGADPTTGAGGTARKLVEGLAGWITNFFGKTMNLGDSNAQTINLGTAGSPTINAGSSGAAINISAGSGDIVINLVSHMNHTHSNVTPGSGTSGPPVPG